MTKLLLGDVCKQWVLANISADTGVLAIVDSNHVLSWGEDVPSDRGVYVRAMSDQQEQFANDIATIYVRCVGNGDDECSRLMAEVQRAMAMVSGQSRSFNVAPSTKLLHITSIRRGTSSLPERDGPVDNTYAGTLQFNMRGRTLSSP